MKSIPSPLASLPRRIIGALFATLLLASTTVFAGPPLICHPYEIGQAKSLPTGSGKFGSDPSYDRTHLVADTLALLTPEVPVLVRMETIRRTAIYAAGNLRVWDGQKYTNVDKELGAQLIAKLRERTTTAENSAKALALFDLGFFCESVRQTGLDPSVDGYDLLVKAHQLRGPDAAMEFALALASWAPLRKEHAGHLARARAEAKPDSLLTENLVSHFGKS